MNPSKSTRATTAPRINRQVFGSSTIGDTDLGKLPPGHDFGHFGRHVWPHQKNVGNVHARIVQKQKRQSTNKMWLGDFVDKKLPYKHFPTSHVTNLLPSWVLRLRRSHRQFQCQPLNSTCEKTGQDTRQWKHTLSEALKQWWSQNTCTVCQVCHVEICGKRRLWIGRISRIHEDGNSYTFPSTAAAMPHR